jgi:hypothetical protein
MLAWAISASLSLSFWAPSFGHLLDFTALDRNVPDAAFLGIELVSACVACIGMHRLFFAMQQFIGDIDIGLVGCAGHHGVDQPSTGIDDGAGL